MINNYILCNLQKTSPKDPTFSPKKRQFSGSDKENEKLKKLTEGQREIAAERVKKYCIIETNYDNLEAENKRLQERIKFLEELREVQRLEENHNRTMQRESLRARMENIRTSLESSENVVSSEMVKSKYSLTSLNLSHSL
ncbi:6830_t:CDS:2 [Cetraspora pellucida]|uniref:6830_t:CDS:1 n=1 Tax=Cetraspora pellucida TaxID=1433469 RepID=A0A9N8Z0Z9_9GLOM|nr:6830_t:CDS:2 [Cetraspora pellucida]